MKTLSRLLAFSAITFGVAAYAAPINLTVDVNGLLLHEVGVASRTEYQALTGGNGNNPSDDFKFLTGELGYWNSAGNLPTMTLPSNSYAKDDLNANDYSSKTGWDFIVLHFGSGNAGYNGAPTWVPPEYKNGKLKNGTGIWVTELIKSSGGWYQAFYIGGISYDFSRPNPGPGDDKVVGGFSYATYFGKTEVPPPPPGDKVPDTGSTIALLGLSLVGFGFAARRK